MKNINLLIAGFIIFSFRPLMAQDNIGMLKAGFAIRAAGGINMFGPLNVSKADLFSKIDIVYDYTIVKETKQNPIIGFSLVGNITPFNKRLNDADYINYNVMQTGVVGFTPSLYMISKPNSNLKLFLNASAGIQYYPLIRTDDTNWGKLDGFDQRLVGFGGGLEYNIIRTSLQAFRRWHDFSTRSEEYYKANVNEYTSLSNLHYNLTITPWPSNKFYLFLNWYGRPSSDPRTKFYNVGLGFNISSVTMKSWKGKLNSSNVETKK